MPILICQQCGRMFEVAPSREHSARYCSKECQIAATQKKEAKCECCGKEFNPLNRKNPRFCSRICASAAQSGLSREAYLAKKSADKADPREGKHLCAGVAGKSCGRWITDYRCPQCWEKLRKGSDAEGLPSYEFHGRRSGGMGLVGPGPCHHGRLHRDGRRVLCFADWSKEYGVPAWTSRNGFVKDVNFCRLYCEKRPDIVEVELEGFKA